MNPSALLRSLARTRGVTTAVVCTLTLGIGAVTATFALVDAAILREPPFPEADRLVMLFRTRGQPGEPAHRERWSFARAQLLKRLATSFENVANYGPATVNLTGSDDPEPMEVELVSPSYFAALRVRPALGRVFSADEDSSPGGHPVALIGHDLWRRRYAGNPRILGSVIGVNGVTLTVVGVLPAGFRGLSGDAQVWLPPTMAPSLTYREYLTSDQNFISVVARLRDGVSLERARLEMASLGTAIARAIPSPSDDDPTDVLSGTADALNTVRVDRAMRRSMLMLLAAVVLLHLLACANVTSLLLGRALARRREIAVRIAVGCGQWRLLRQFFAEGMVLAITGGALGMLLAQITLASIGSPAGLRGPRNFYGSIGAFSTPSLDGRAMLFGVALAVATALVVGWGPAVSAVRVDVASGLRDGERGMTQGGLSLRRPSLRGVIVALESALAIILLAAGGLMIESFLRMRRTELGFDPTHVMTFLLRPSDVTVPAAAAPQFLTRVLDAIGRVPGVESATVDGCAPLGTSCANSTLYIAGRPAPRPDEAPPVMRHYVAPGHFRTLGIPLLRGRAFDEQDVAGRPRVAIINEKAARRFWPNADPLGQRVWFGGGSSFDRPDSSATIVGIVGDVAYQPLDERPFQADFYTPYAQFSYAWRMVMVRTVGDPSALLPGLRAAVREVDPDLPLHDVQTMVKRIGGSWSRHRFDAILLAAFATVALFLAASGIYAVVAHAVGQRTREVGIRLALGASPAAVARLVVREGLALPIVGLLIGVFGALAVTRILRASLYEVSPTDPGVFAGTVAVMLGAAVLACLIPAFRATRVDPLVAIRTD